MCFSLLYICLLIGQFYDIDNVEKKIIYLILCDVGEMVLYNFEYIIDTAKHNSFMIDHHWH